jgi:hypothetical protein
MEKRAAKLKEVQDSLNSDLEEARADACTDKKNKRKDHHRDDSR